MKTTLITLGLITGLAACAVPRAVNSHAAGGEPDPTEPLPIPAAGPANGRRPATISLGMSDARDPGIPTPADASPGRQGEVALGYPMHDVYGGLVAGALAEVVPPAASASAPRNVAPGSTMPAPSPDTMPAPSPGTTPAPSPGTMPAPSPGTMPAPSPGTMPAGTPGTAPGGR